MEHSHTVKAAEAGQRIDKFLCSKLPKMSRKQVKALIDSGSVRVNSRRVVIAGWELEQDDLIEVKMPLRAIEQNAKDQAPQDKPRFHKRPEHKAHRPKISASIERHLERKRGRGREHIEKKAKAAGRLKVYYQDRDIIVVEKPAGLLSVPDRGSKDKDSLQKHIRNYLRRRFRQSKNSFLAPLHRLDVETSGIMVFALSRSGQKLSHQFKNHTIGRTYKALVSGRVDREGGVVDRPLEKGDFRHGRKTRPSHARDAKRAITEFKVKERYKKATLLDVLVRTGRTHQIRAHLASEGHPIIGDSVYAKGDAGSFGFRRHALHADSLRFKHPVSGKKISYRSPLPHDMKELIDKLRGGV